MKQHTKPCASCPFLQAKAGMLRGERAEEIADDLRRDKHFICHKAVKRLGGDGTDRLCAGAMIVTHRSDQQPSQYARVMLRIGLLDYAKIEKSAKVPCFDDLDDFVNGHSALRKKEKQ